MSRKTNAEFNAQKNIEDALKNDEFKKIYQSYVTLMIQETRAGKSTPALTKAKKDCESWLKAHNFLPLQTKYFCPKCNDTGFVDQKYCDCLKKEITKILIADSGFTKLEKFENVKFDIFENSQQIKLLYCKMQDWCKQTKHTKNLILLSGGTGVGKTHLIKCMANQLIDKCAVVNLTTAFALNQNLLKAYNSFDIDERNEVLQKYLSPEYLFIDDLGTEIKQKGITVNLLYLIINERKMKNLCTIITTNLDLQEIREQYDERIFSRIADRDSSICIKIDGNDLRLKNKK